MKKVVIFDMDGTLLDTEPLYFRSNKEAFAEIGEELTTEHYHPFIGSGSENTRIGFGKLLNDEEKGNAVFARADALFKDIIANEVPALKPHVLDLLNALQAREIDCYVASSSHYDLVAEMMTRLNIAKYFKGYIGGNQVAEAKPHPDIFLKALDLSGYSATEALVVEDSLNGVRASYRAHMDVIMVPDLVEPNEEVFEKALAVVAHINDILPFVD